MRTLKVSRADCHAVLLVTLQRTVFIFHRSIQLPIKRWWLTRCVAGVTEKSVTRQKVVTVGGQQSASVSSSSSSSAPLPSSPPPPPTSSSSFSFSFPPPPPCSPTSPPPLPQTFIFYFFSSSNTFFSFFFFFFSSSPCSSSCTSLFLYFSSSPYSNFCFFSSSSSSFTSSSNFLFFFSSSNFFFFFFFLLLLPLLQQLTHMQSLLCELSVNSPVEHFGASYEYNHDFSSGGVWAVRHMKTVLICFFLPQVEPVRVLFAANCQDLHTVIVNLWKVSWMTFPSVLDM